MKQQAKHDSCRKLRVLEFALIDGNVSQASRFFGRSRNTFYSLKRNYETHGEHGLVNSKLCPENLKIRVAPDIEKKISFTAPKSSSICSSTFSE
jgi:hypothetical protein